MYFQVMKRISYFARRMMYKGLEFGGFGLYCLRSVVRHVELEGIEIFMIHFYVVLLLPVGDHFFYLMNARLTNWGLF